MRYYLFLFCLFASSSSMALLDDHEDKSLSQHPSSSSSAPCCSTDMSEPSSSEVYTLNSLLDFIAILENPESVNSGLKFNFTPTVDQLSDLASRLPSLRFLDLSNTDVTNDVIGPLLALKNLEYLDLSSTNVRNVGAVFDSQGQETATLELQNNILRPSSYPNLSINLQYTIRAPLVAGEEVPEEYFDGFIHQNQIKVNTPEELYEQLNNSANEPRDRKWGELTFSYTPSLKQLQHIVMIQPHLRIINLSGTTISDVSPLSKLPALRELKLKGTPISDLSYFPGFSALNELDLSGTAITNAEASFLGGVTNLYHLNLSDTAVTDVSYLPDQLMTLDLDNTKITGVLSLTNLTSLYALYLSGTAITNISPLTNLINLYSLFLKNTKIKDIPPLVGLTELAELDLSDTAVTDVSPVASLPNLRALGLRNTDIVDLTPLADRQDLEFNTNIGILRRGSRPTAIQKHYYSEMRKKAPPTAVVLTKSADNFLKRVASKAEEYLRSTKAEREPNLRYYTDPRAWGRCFQRASYEIGRISKIQQLIKGSEEFMNLSDQEKSYAALIKAEMLASIEGRLLLNHPPSELFVRAQEELRLAEKELLSETFSKLRNYYLYKGYSEEKFRIFQQLYLRYRCKYGIEPEPYIHDALSTVSCELMSPCLYVNYGPHQSPYQRMYFCLGTADYLFRGFSFEFFGEKCTTKRTYDKPREASCMLQAYQNNLRLGTSLFERLWLHLFSELQ